MSNNTYKSLPTTIYSIYKLRYKKYLKNLEKEMSILQLKINMVLNRVS